jgi:hypothetical protein
MLLTAMQRLLRTFARAYVGNARKIRRLAIPIKPTGLGLYPDGYAVAAAKAEVVTFTHDLPRHAGGDAPLQRWQVVRINRVRRLQSTKLIEGIIPEDLKIGLA